LSPPPLTPIPFYFLVFFVALLHFFLLVIFSSLWWMLGLLVWSKKRIWKNIVQLVIRCWQLWFQTKSQCNMKVGLEQNLLQKQNKAWELFKWVSCLI
jgi:hypothetical protein